MSTEVIVVISILSVVSLSLIVFAWQRIRNNERMK